MHIVCTEFYEIHGFQDFSRVVKVLYLLVSRRTSCLFLVTMTEITALQAGEGHSKDVGLTLVYMIFLWTCWCDDCSWYFMWFSWWSFKNCHVSLKKNLELLMYTLENSHVEPKSHGGRFSCFFFRWFAFLNRCCFFRFQPLISSVYLEDHPT